MKYKKYIFYLHCIISILFLILSTIEILDFFNFSNSFSNFTIIISNSILLRTTHIGFTFLILNNTSPGKNLLNIIKLNKTMLYLLFLIAILIITYTIFYLVFNFGYTSKISQWTMCIFYTLTAHHVVSQTIGLIKIKRTSNINIFIENKILDLIKILSILITFLWIVNEFNLIIVPNQLTRTCSIVLFLSIIINVLFIFFRDQKQLVEPIIYLRFILYGLQPYSFLSGIGIGIVHGFEYLDVFLKQASDKKYNLTFYLVIFFTLFLFMTLSLLSKNIGLPLLLYFNHNELPFIIKAITSLTMSLTLLHFLLDRLLYSRKYYGPRVTTYKQLLESEKNV